MDTILKQYELPEGSTVLVPTVEGFHRYTYVGMPIDKIVGMWLINLREVEPVEMRANLFGTFHYNASQDYYYYEPEDSDV